VLRGIVFVLDPGGKLTVERVEGGEVELSGEKRFADGSEEAFDLSFLM
jgi:hypothetical protein